MTGPQEQWAAFRAEKERLRKEIRGRLRAIPPAEAKQSNALICRRLLQLPEYNRARMILGFAGINWEIRLTAFFAQALADGKRIALPRVTGPGQMEIRTVSSLRDLVPGAYGIPAPSGDEAICARADIDLAVVPCVSCDKSCRRLGQGGGFYDRFLTAAGFPSAAVCRDAGMAEEIPAAPWDQPVDLVVTETQVYRRSLETGEAQKR